MELIVEDNGKGFDFDHVARPTWQDGRQALELVERLQPDVVVMDVAMPRLNGVDATLQIKHRFPDVKVVILTTHENREYLV